MGTNTEMEHTQRGDLHGVGTHMEWGNGDTYGDGTHTKREHLRRRDTYGVKGWGQIRR